MAKLTKRNKKFAELDREKLYTVEEAVAVLKEVSNTKFDESVEVAMNLGVDPRHADQMVRGVVALPNGTGKTVKVAVFAKDDKAEEAKAAGADYVGGEELAAEIQGGMMDFDRCIATPDMMGVVGRLGKVLGPRGLMPNPKVGTVSADVETAVKNAKAGQVRYRTDKAGIIHCTIGKVSFEPNALQENLAALLADLNKAKPASAKGVYMKRITVSSTMGPGLQVDTASV